MATTLRSGATTPSYARKGDPVVYRYEVQGPGALDVIREVIGTEPPQVKFFHGAHFTIAGRSVRALRHGMAAEPGFRASRALGRP